MLVGLVIILAILYATHLYIRRGNRGKYLDRIPGPPGWPILGNILRLMVTPEQLWILAREMDATYYPFYKYWLLHIPVVTILEAENAEILLSSTEHIEKSDIYRLLQPWFNTGLLTSTGDKWHKRRKILTSAFHFNVLQKYIDIILEHGDKTAQALKAEGESVQSLLPFLAKYTLNVICEAAMGIPVHEKGDAQEKYRKAVHDMGDVLIYRLVRPWYNNEWIFGLTSMGRKQKKALSIMHEFSRNIIQERKEYHEKTDGHFLRELTSDDREKTEEANEIYGHRKKRLAMLDLLIAAQRDGGQIDDHGIREEVDTFMFEGHDTSAMGLSFALLLFAEHKEVQERMRAEVNEVLSNSNKLGITELQRLHYVERCIKEALRLYPSVPFISRNIHQDLQLKDYMVPKGTLVNMHIFAIHRDANQWPNPKTFDPDRFLPENVKDRHPFAYVPFSAGPRNCIGQKFAMLELKAFVAHLIQHFYLEPIDLAHEVPMIPDIVLRPARPIHVKFVPIEK